MDTSSQRELLPVGAACSITQVMADLAQALAGKGPALGFGNLKSRHVPQRVAVVISTSGSTGAPKEVGLSASALLGSARASNKYLGANFGQIWSLLLPLTHVAGVNVLVRSLELGTRPIDLRDRSKYSNADFTAIVPTQLFRALNGDTLLLKHLKNCQAVLIGGAALPPEIRQRANHLGITLVSTYGMTETCGGCVYDGIPLDCVEVGTTAEGAIKIKGLTLAVTYVDDPGSWDQALDDGWFITHDLGTINAGKLLVQGRIDDVIITGGEKISLTSIEAALAARYPKNEFAAFAVPDPEWGMALYVAIAGKSSISTDEVRAHLALSLGTAAKPKGFLTLTALPLMGIGKVDREALTQLAIHERQIR